MSMSPVIASPAFELGCRASLKAPRAVLGRWRGCFGLGWIVGVVGLLVLVAAMAVAPAARAAYAPVNEPGPALDAPLWQLQAAVTCSPNVGHAELEPVLLVPGTWLDFQEWFSWNFAVALSKEGIPWCGVSPPEHQSGDTQTAGEYDAYAIRYLYGRSRQRIAIVGHSQGGMQPRWALRFWPDTRAMVADYVGIAGPNQGATTYGLTSGIGKFCRALGYCPITVYQQTRGSNFISALNSRQEMFPRIDYTIIYSTTDEIVAPADTPLSGAGSYARIALQDVCRARIADHLQDGSIDSVSWALTLDAITHPGPAHAARIPRSACNQSINPELNPVRALADLAQATADIVTNIAQMPYSHGEPPLACYVFTGCSASGTGTVLAASQTVTHCTRTGHTCAITTRPTRTLRGRRGTVLRYTLHLHTSTGNSLAGAPMWITDGVSLTNTRTGARGNTELTLRPGSNRTIIVNYAGTNLHPGTTLSLKIRYGARPRSRPGRAG